MICQKETKAGRRKHKVALPWCVNISDGIKVLIRNRHCMCPSGWRDRDKCLSPNVDHIVPCSFNDPYNSPDSDHRILIGTLIRILRYTCLRSRRKIDGPLQNLYGRNQLFDGYRVRWQRY